MTDKKTHNKIKRIVAITLCAFIAVITLMAIKASKEYEREGYISTAFYYLSAGSTSMVSETSAVIDGTNEEIIMSVLKRLKEGPKTEGYIPTIPLEILFNSASLDEEGTVTVDLSKEYNDAKVGQEVVCRVALVWTLTELDFINNVLITVDDVKLSKGDGEPIGLMNRENVVIDATLAPESKKYLTVKLYFTNMDASALLLEERKIVVNQNIPNERAVLDELILGPKKEGLISTVPSETKIRDITTTDDGVCYVNLSSEFVSKHAGGSTSEIMTIYSIVNTLTQLQNIDRVQFLIDGEKQEEYKGHLDFSQPFVEDMSLVK